MKNEKLEIFRGSNRGQVSLPLFRGLLFVLLRAEGEFCKKIKKNKNNYFKY